MIDSLLEVQVAERMGTQSRCYWFQMMSPRQAGFIFVEWEELETHPHLSTCIFLHSL